MRTELHPSEQQLNDFLLGKVPDAEQSAIEAHLAECVACQNWAATLHPADTFVGLLASAQTHNDLSRAAAATPSLSPLSTPTLAWQAPGLLPAIHHDLPPVLANHPKYHPVQLLGSGGMGSVWLAKHTVMNRQVAVKVIRPDLSARPQAASRFIREIQAAGMLKCEYIVTAYDAEEIDSACLLVMEYVPGQTLAEALKSGPLPANEACRAARDAALGLAHAHAAGYVHRDVKPS